jgi:hypothetical protein
MLTLETSDLLSSWVKAVIEEARTKAITVNSTDRELRLDLITQKLLALCVAAG